MNVVSQDHSPRQREINIALIPWDSISQDQDGMELVP